MNAFPSECRRAWEQAQPLEPEEHLRSCERCRNLAQARRAMLLAIADLPVVSPPSSAAAREEIFLAARAAQRRWSRRVLRPATGAALAACLVLAIGGVWLRIDRDSDGDGLPDRIDRCPEMKGEAGLLGCPFAISELDTDGDGILDEVDGCPDLAGEAAFGGCPAMRSAFDRDGDGIADGEDHCPDQPGLKANDGCPG